jgi:hypothetical protein
MRIYDCCLAGRYALLAVGLRQSSCSRLLPNRGSSCWNWIFSIWSGITSPRTPSNCVIILVGVGAVAAVVLFIATTAVALVAFRLVIFCCDDDGGDSWAYAPVVVVTAATPITIIIAVINVNGFLRSIIFYYINLVPLGKNIPVNSV